MIKVIKNIIMVIVGKIWKVMSLKRVIFKLLVLILMIFINNLIKVKIM